MQKPNFITHTIKQAGKIILLLLFCNTSFGQNEMEKGCIEKLKISQAGYQFSRSSEAVILKGDTIIFEKTQVILKNSSPEAFLIFQKGLLTPSMIMGASTNGDGQIRKSIISDIGSLTVHSFNELKLAGQASNIKTFSFLIWTQGFANPKLYVLELKNNNTKKESSFHEFIESAQISAFGFCSILL